jgi:hypothetical protein
MKRLRPLLFFVALLLAVGLACSVFSGPKDTPTPPPPTDEPIIIDEPTPLPDPTEAPLTEEPIPTEVIPTEPPVPQSQPFFTEEFDNPLSSDWSTYIIYDETESDTDKVKVEAEDGNLVWDFDSKYVYYYLFYSAYEYEDVQLEVRADNRGKNNNSVSLICRYDPDAGWYEFNIANNGLYDILYAEVLDSGKIRWNPIANGGSNDIKAGLEVNEYLIKCEGDELTLEVNGADVISIRDKNYGLRKGQVGVSVSSFNVLPVLIEMDWIKISEP